MIDKSRDPVILAGGQYKTADKLNDRWNLYNYSLPKINIYTHALRALKLTGLENILEVGCGDGSVLLSLRKQMHHQGGLTGLEINDTIVSPTKDYLSAHAELKPIDFIVGSADRLPIKSNSVDIILAFFMLYHMPVIPKALSELRRVLVPHGKVIVSTTSSNNRPKGKALKLKMADIARVSLPYSKLSDPFNLENGQKQLEEVFKVVGKFVYEGEIRVTDPEIYLKSMESTKDLLDPMPSEVSWQKARHFVKDKMQEEINKFGYFSDSVKRGYFICQPFN